MTTINSQPEMSEADILTLFCLRTELQKRARGILEEIKRIEGEITRQDQERLRCPK